jgi:hypothetical protein
VRIEGRLLVPAPTRTLDELNRRGAPLLRLVEARWTSRRAEGGERPVWRDAVRLGVRKESIVLVEETGPPPPRSPGGGASYARAPIHLELGRLVAQGYVHVPRGGEPLARFESSDAPTFIAMTAASVVGEELSLAVPFLAVNRLEVALACGLASPAADEEPALATSASGLERNA